ncbi:MAG: type II toxin-antitoxin system HicA family toxin [Fimbriimonadales bacterium]|jgi:predicted RNA binding protein YcfA (HicA-like mRNA interferase family)|nr:type II toxin-antitoxin system HicA family toxin [Fimbriimonadales bacterium]
MPKLAGINHKQAVRALQKAGFRVAREGKHIVMTDGVRIITIPRANPINPYTMGGIIRDAGLTIEQFKELLK